MNLFADLLSTEFLPHGHCYLWRSSLVSLHLVSDALITLAYYSIPVMLLYFVQKKRDVPFHWIFLMFGTFILACGTTHAMEIWTLWHPTYWLSGAVKALTAIVSVATAIALVPLVPQALALRSPAELEAANRALQSEIAQHKRTEVELMRSNADLEHFAYVASHDLQEPLRVVASYTQLLARRYQGKLDADADEFIRFTVDSVTRMQSQILDLLAYSRLSRVSDGFVKVDLQTAFTEAVKNLRQGIQEADATVTADPLPEIMGDRPQIIQLLQNLIGNAVKFRGERAPVVHVSVRRTDSRYEVSVADNGIGIDPQYFERIFVIFQRLHTRERYPGTGIGLAICKKIIERHGGRIWVESSPAGSTFRFTLAAA